MLKTTCRSPECQQPIEYPAEMGGQPTSCPSCGITLLLPELPFWDRAPWCVLKRIFMWVCYFFEGLYYSLKGCFDVYFDTKSPQPDNTSPYYIVLRFMRTLYNMLATLWLIGMVSFPFSLNYPDDSSKLVISYFAWVGGWLLFYFGYKLVRVIFDIAEYSRQIAKQVDKP